MKKILILAIIIISGCCENKVETPYKVVEKLHTQDRDGIFIHYTLLLENGTELDVTSKEYVKAKIGDSYYVTECNDYTHEQ